MQTDSLDVGMVIRRAREDVALSQSDLALAVGLHPSDLAALESGTCRVDPELVDRLLRAARLRPSLALELLADRVRLLADEFGLRDVRVFGSSVRGTDHERSDVDLLVSADPAVTFLGIAAFQDRAEGLLGFRVDVVLDDAAGEVMIAIRREAVSL